MTVIAGKVYKNKITIAGERAISQNSLLMHSKVPKIIKPLPNLVIGAAGDARLCQEVTGYPWSDTDLKKIPKILTKIWGESDDPLDILYATDRLYSWDQGVLLEHDYFAVGDGAQIALGAMWAGKDPSDAVLAAIHHISSCSGYIDVESVDF